MRSMQKMIENYTLNVIDNDKGNIVKRLYQTLGNEVVKTNFGSFDTIKVSASSPESSEIIYFLAPNWITLSSKVMFN